MADPYASMIPRPGMYQEKPKTWTERNLDPLTQALLGRGTAQAGREAENTIGALARKLAQGAKFGVESFGPQADVADLTRGAQQMGQGVAGLDWRKLLEGGAQAAGGILGFAVPGSFGGMKRGIDDMAGAPAPRKARGAFEMDYFGSPVRLLQNPTNREIHGFINRTKYKAARRVVDPDTGDVYIWDAGDPALHAMVAEKLGVRFDADTVADMIEID